MSKTWQVQEAKARFGELLEASLKEGPQIVTKRGVGGGCTRPHSSMAEVGKEDRANLEGLDAGVWGQDRIPYPLAPSPSGDAGL